MKHAACDLACAQPLHSVTGFFLGVWGSGHGKLAKLAHQKALEKSLGKPDLPLTWSCPMLRLSHMVADMGECLPGAHSAPARHALSIKYPDFSPRFTL